MGINFLHNFFEGETSEYLKRNLNISFDTFENVSLSKVQDVSFSEIQLVDGRMIMKEGENEYLMFAYLKKYNTGKHRGYPKFHTRECKTIKKYVFAQFTYTNQMPVDVYSTSEGRLIRDVNLDLCKNCSNEGILAVFSKSDWQDQVLDYVATLSNPITRKDGYITYWAQVSEAYRTKKNWTCEKCKLNLKEDRRYLHTHHKDGDKLNNNRSNFECLCILCHAFEHFDKEKRGEGFLELGQFVNKYESQLKKLRSNNLQRWKEFKQEQIKIIRDGRDS